MGSVLRSACSGFALPVALVAMIATGAVVTGGFYAVTPERSTAAVPDLSGHAALVAEFGLRSALAETAAGVPPLHAAPTGQPVTVYRTGSGSATYLIEVRQLSDSTAILRSEGRVVLEGSEAVREALTVIPLR